MERKPKERGKYKKHKEDFKIVVEYKLNTKLKSMHSFDGRELYPVYVEVRAKRKRTFFPSVHSFYVDPEEFTTFLSNGITRSIIEEQTKKITDIILAFETDSIVPTEALTLQYKNWLNFYQVWDYQLNVDVVINRRIFSLLLKTFSGSDALITKFTHVLSKIKYFKETIEFLTSMAPSFQDPNIQESINVLRAYLRVREFLSLYSKEWLLPSVHGIFYLDQTIRMSLLLHNQHIIQKIKSLGNQSDMFFFDLALIETFLSKDEYV